MEPKLNAKIRDYGIIGNCRTAALVSRFGSIDWCCFPRFDSPALFCALLDPEIGGHFSIRPREDFEYWQSWQSYRGETNLLETYFRRGNSLGKVTDLFVAQSEDQKRHQLHADHEIIRWVECLEGEMEWEFAFSPRWKFGQGDLALKRVGRWGIECLRDGTLLLLQSTLDHSTFILDDRTGVRGGFKLKRGESAAFSLSHSIEAPAVLPPISKAWERLKSTEKYWKHWISRCTYRGIFREQMRRSALALKLLCFAPSGAVVAAPTTSLPEWLGGTRNWDYRFCWLRDASFTVRALLKLGYEEEARSFMGWLLHATRLTRPGLQVIYSVFGEASLPEKILPWLSGYHRSKPVRVGNQASDQFQLDIYGELVDAFFNIAPNLEWIDRDTQKLLVGIGEHLARCWMFPDNGIWEFRGTTRHYTHSKVMCWVAMDRLSQLCKIYGWRSRTDFGKVADQIRKVVDTMGTHPTLGYYTQYFGSDRVDASLLTLPLVGYCHAMDPKMQKTIRCVESQLARDGLVYRYEPGSDGLSDREGAFGICTFWLGGALARAGRVRDAERLIRRFISLDPGLGLFPEEFDPKSKEFLGNFPQAFTHVGLIHAIDGLNRAIDRGGVAA